MKTVAIIPARGGSKGIPRKNIKDFCGKPLISYIISTALNTPDLDRVIVSTEDQEIADISKKYGAEVPFLRPIELSRDETPTFPVIKHAIQYLEKEEKYFPDIVALLYPTSPLLSSDRIKEAIEMMKTGLDSVVSVIESKGHYWIKNKDYQRLYPINIQNRQYTLPIFKENGAIYIVKRDLLIKQDILVGGKLKLLIMKKEESIDIDNSFDFEMAEYIMKQRIK